MNKRLDMKPSGVLKSELKRIGDSSLDEGFTVDAECYGECLNEAVRLHPNASEEQIAAWAAYTAATHPRYNPGRIKKRINEEEFLRELMQAHNLFFERLEKKLEKSMIEKRKSTRRVSATHLAITLLAVLLALYGRFAFAVVGPTQAVSYTTTGGGNTISMVGTGVRYHSIAWYPEGTVSACTVKLEKSATGTGGWTDLIANQTCTATSASSFTLDATANYVRINVTALSGGGTLMVRYAGYATDATSVFGSDAGPASFGGGTQYSHGTTQATPTGTVAMGKNPSNVINAVSLDASGNLNVNIAAGGGGGGTSSNFGSAFPSAGTAAGFSDGTNMQGARVFDADTGAGAQYVAGVNLRLGGSGGSVEGGTSTNPIRTDPTGTTTQPVSGTVTANAGTGPFPVSDNAGSLTVDAPVGTPLAARLSDGTAFLTTTSGRLSVDGSGVTQPVSGTVTSNIGTGNLAGITGTVTTTGTKTNNNAAPGATNLGALTAVSTASAPSYTEGNLVALSVDNSGLLRTSASVTPASDVTATGDLTSATSVTTATLNGSTAIGVYIFGTWVGTVQFEGSIDGTNYFSVNARPMANGTLVTSTTANGQWQLDSGSLATFRARVSAYTSGTVSIRIRSSTGPGAKPIQISGSDGSSIVAATQFANGAAIGTGVGDLTHGSVTTSAPSYSTGTVAPLSLETTGNLRTAVIAALPTGTNVIGNIGVTQGSTTSGQSGPLMQAAVTTGSPTYTTAQTSPLSLDTSGNLRVNVVAGGGSGGTSSSFGSAFPGTGTAVGFSDGTNMQGARVFDSDTGAGTQYVAGVNLRIGASGGSVEGGTSANPIRIDPTGTTTQPVSGTVTANAGTGTFRVDGAAASGAAKAGNPVQVGGVFNTTQPTVTTGQAVELQATARGAAIVSTGVDTFNVTVNAALPTGSNTIGALTANQSVNVAQIAGTATSTGNGVSGAGVQRVTIASDSTGQVAIAGTATVAGAKTNNNAVPGATNVGALTAVSTASAPSYTEGNLVALSVDNSGSLRTTASPAAVNDVTATGDLTATGSVTTATLNGSTAVGIYIFGTWVATVQFEASIDGTTYFSVNALPITGGALVTSTTGNGQWQVNSGGYANVRARVSAYTSGTVSIRLRSSTGPGLISLATALPTGTNTIGALSANQSVNVAQINGVTTTTDNGVSGTGVQRVTLASDSTGQVALAAGANTIGALSANQSVNVTQFGGTNVVTGTGAGGAGIPRVTISNDSSLAANQSVNISQMNGVTVTMNNGVAGTGVQRVAIASDNSNAPGIGGSATGSAVPSAAQYQGGAGSGSTGGNLVGMPVCDSYANVNVSTATTTLIVTGVSGRQVRICSQHLVTAAANNVAWIEGTGATCGTGSAGMAGGTTAASGYNFAANGGIAQGSGLGTIMRTATTGDSVCIVTSAATQLSGGISYTIY